MSDLWRLVYQLKLQDKIKPALIRAEFEKTYGKRPEVTLIGEIVIPLNSTGYNEALVIRDENIHIDLMLVPSERDALITAFDRAIEVLQAPEYQQKLADLKAAQIASEAWVRDYNEFEARYLVNAIHAEFARLYPNQE